MPLRTMISGVKGQDGGATAAGVPGEAVTATGAGGPDESARLRAELEALRAELDQFRRHLPEAFVELELPSIHVRYMNQVAMALLGYTEGDIAAGLSGFSMLDERSMLEVLDAASKHMAESVWLGKPYQRERGQRIFHLTLVRKDGSTFPADVQGAYVLDDAGMPCGVRYIFRDTSERTFAEQERARLAALVEWSDDAIVSRGLDGRVLSWNRGAERLYGYTADEMIGQTIDRLELPERRGELAHQLDPQRAGDTVTFETKRITRDGRVLDVSLSLFPVRDTEGRVIAVGGIARDIGDRIRAAEAVSRSNEMLTALATAQTDFILGETPREVFERLLEVALRLTGSEYGFIAEAFRHPDGRPYLRTRALTDISWDDASRRMYETHRGEGMIFDNPDSLFGSVLTSGQPVIANDPANDPRRAGLPPGHPPLRAFLGLPIHMGERLLGVVGLANRVGGYARDEVLFLQPFLTTCGTILEAMNTQAARRAAEERLDLAMRGADLVLWEWDLRDNRYTSQMPGGRAVVRHAGLMDGIAGVIGQVHPDDRVTAAVAFSQHLQGTTPMIEAEIRIEVGGEYRWVLTRGTAVERDAAGRPVRVAGTVLDVSERKAAAEERLRLEQQMRQSQRLESLGVFAGGIAHDFNNLLTAILGNLFLLRKGLAGAELELADEARQAAERGAELVRRLLTFARPEVETYDRVPLDRLIDETASLARSVLGPQVQLVVHHGSGLAEVSGSWTSLQQVLLNLMVNARDAMPDGGTLTILRRVVNLGPDHRWAPPELPRGRYYVISVSDTGHGMDESLVERIFDPFFTTKEVGRGTGLGLPTALGIARAHGGWLAVESTPGKGSTFRLLLPAT